MVLTHLFQSHSAIVALTAVSILFTIGLAFAQVPFKQEKQSTTDTSKPLSSNSEQEGGLVSATPQSANASDGLGKPDADENKHFIV